MVVVSVAEYHLIPWQRRQHVYSENVINVLLAVVAIVVLVTDPVLAFDGVTIVTSSSPIQHHWSKLSSVGFAYRPLLTKNSVGNHGKNDNNNSINRFHSVRSYDCHRRHSRTSLASQYDNDEDTRMATVLDPLNVAIIGGGPSGLLLAHGLLQAGANVNLYEQRSRPGELELEQRAYALGVGLRGRTAIQTVDESYVKLKNKNNNNNNNDAIKPLWDAVKARGYGSERFVLHVGPLSLRLRDENDVDDSSTTGANGNTQQKQRLEPSLLLFQSDLCRALADELEVRWQSSGRLSMQFDAAVTGIDLKSKTFMVRNGQTPESLSSSSSRNFDLIVGCDGVNSVVRNAMTELWGNETFQASQELLPGFFKAVQLPNMPPLLDPSAVQLLLPKKGAVTCFVEPTANGRCCLLFAGKNDPTDILVVSNNTSTNVTAIEEELIERFPKLVGCDIHGAAKQLMEQLPSQASKVSCNIFHTISGAVLIGDAAHATGGVSGQGVNSALQDSAALVDSLITTFRTRNPIVDTDIEPTLQQALLRYSQKAVPEAKALYDLSFGPANVSSKTRFILTLKNIIDSLFRGRFGIGERPLNTLLTTSLRSFADIRRDRNDLYEAIFPLQEEWDTMLSDIHTKQIKAITPNTVPSNSEVIM